MTPQRLSILHDLHFRDKRRHRPCPSRPIGPALAKTILYHGQAEIVEASRFDMSRDGMIRLEVNNDR